MSFLTKVQSAGIATLLLSMSIFLSRCIGLIRDKLISWNFGATTETDIYFIAFIIPDFINYLLAGGYFSIILVPLLTKYFAQGEREGYRFFSTIL
ncbi:MAG: murein biosynthesis integral membrane protein MurJ, partial [Desulfovibrionaceae bacterium]|nr:murein biosynthesis integral membrane protein MurJ [Desulfovibrionaceae bacterium]